MESPSPEISEGKGKPLSVLGLRGDRGLDKIIFQGLHNLLILT